MTYVVMNMVMKTKDGRQVRESGSGGISRITESTQKNAHRNRNQKAPRKVKRSREKKAGGSPSGGVVISLNIISKSASIYPLLSKFERRKRKEIPDIFPALKTREP
jgi:hypothetical protein